MTPYSDSFPPAATPPVAVALKRISWGAILAGTVLALVIQLALSLLGLGVGLGTIDPLTEQDPMAGIGIGAVVWWVVSMLVSLYLGASVAARLAGMPRPTDGLLHGLLTWSVVTLFTFYLLTTAVGRIIGGVTGVAGRALSGVGSGIAAVAPKAGEALKDELKERGIDLGDVKREARLLLRQTGKAELSPENLERQAKTAGSEAKDEAGRSAANPQAADDNFDELIDRLGDQARGIGNAADRDAAVNVVMKRTGKSRAESEQIVDNWIATAKKAQAQLAEVKEKAAATAREAADKAAAGLSKTALLMALGLGLGAAAAAFGGRRAAPRSAVVA
ncbi:hypothetical protein FNT36_15615 [Hymenobacter setariae]|uniref:PhnA-like protein n=1 Tax=Hymenobacter setariae TaxID=2594794 RepID=A0A558BRE4_9BACT|nr:hypothetical protein [Hymenobacter setariae]TVT39090.1 hypothetical protein FNT36_15615 [Hymenobacter setariae]